MNADVRQRGVGFNFFNAAAFTIPLVLLVFAMIFVGQSANSWIGYAIMLAAFVWFFFWGMRPLVWWSGTELRIDETGLFFGRNRRRRRPAQVAVAARNPYLVPWPAASNLRIVRSRRAVREMWSDMAQKSRGLPQVTAYLGYFPVPGRAAIVFDVDLSLVEVPQVVLPKQASVRVNLNEPERETPTWAFPVRRAEPVLEALRARGIHVTETDEPQPPKPDGQASRASIIVHEEWQKSFDDRLARSEAGNPLTKKERRELDRKMRARIHQRLSDPTDQPVASPTLRRSHDEVLRDAVTDVLTKNLGRPPTEEEINDLYERARQRDT